jgi:hypothetical protein
MPNWCTNELTVQGTAQQLDRVREALRGKDGEALALGSLLPIPETLDIESDSSNTLCEALYRYKAEGDQEALEELSRLIAGRNGVPRNAILSPRQVQDHALQALQDQRLEEEEALARGRQLLENKRLYGHATWYEWCMEHWGTKWEVDLDQGWDWEQGGGAMSIRFETAWDPPIPFYRALASRFPDLAFRAEWAEGGNAYAGYLKRAEGGEDLEEGHFSTDEEMGRDIARDLGVLWDDEEEDEDED